MRNEENAIEVIDMSKDFKRVYDKPSTLKERLVFWKKANVELHHVLKGINLDIKQGETVALIGTNGSGKSTLLKLMTKILYPTRGKIVTYGKLTSLLELGAGFHPDFTGRENIYFNASIFGLTRADIDKRIDEIIEFSELGGFIDNPIRTYSSGMYMRLAFSIAINVDAEILLIDEILAVGDQHFQDKCFDKLKELRESDKTIVIVSHSLDVVKDLCDRAIWIYNGEFRLDGDPTYVIEEYIAQVNEDHKKEMKKAIEQGLATYKGIVFIDAPLSYETISKDKKKITITGWSLSNSEKTKLRVLINKEPVLKITPKCREDVLHVYQEQYGAFVDKDTIGFSCDVDMMECKEDNLTIEVLLECEGSILAQKEIVVNII